MQAAEAQAHLLNGLESDVQHVIIGQHISHTVTGQQHQPVRGVQRVGVDKRLGADERLRGLERKVTQRTVTHKDTASGTQEARSRHAETAKLPVWTAGTPVRLLRHQA